MFRDDKTKYYRKIPFIGARLYTEFSEISPKIVLYKRGCAYIGKRLYKVNFVKPVS